MDLRVRCGLLLVCSSSSIWLKLRVPTPYLVGPTAPSKFGASELLLIMNGHHVYISY